MNKALFSVTVADVEREDQHRSWDIPVDWLMHALEDTEANPTGKIGQLTVSLLKNGSQFLVRGTVKASVSLPCARTLEPAVYDLSADLLVVLERGTSKKPGNFEPKRRRKPETRAEQKAKKKEEDETLLSEDDAAFDTFTGDEIELDRFVREHLLLELPMFPLRSDLRSAPAPAIRPPFENAPGQTSVDPRLLPLQALADKLKADKN